MSKSNKYFITGGAGFIGAHIVNYLIDETNANITVYDNFENGRLYAFGERINLELNGTGIWICPKTGDKYTLIKAQMIREKGDYWNNKK